MRANGVPCPNFAPRFSRASHPALRSPHGVLPRFLEPHEQQVPQERPEREHLKEVERRELLADVKAAPSAAQQKREDARTANVSPETETAHIAAAQGAKSQDERSR